MRLGGHAQGAHRGLQAVREWARAAHVHIALRDVGHEPAQRRLVEGRLRARADHFVELPTAHVHQLCDLVAQDEVGRP